jgi:hypothetical protein
MFLIKKANIVVDFFTETHIFPGINAPDKAIKFLPQWWRELPGDQLHPKQPWEQGGGFNAGTTLRKCPGFIDYFRSSIALPMWSDLVLSVEAEGSPHYTYQFSDRTSVAEAHRPQQRGAYLPETKYQHIKLVNPWAAKTKQNVQWVFSQPTWCFLEPQKIIIPSGVLCLKDQHGLHVNMMVPRAAGETTVLNFAAGQPLAFLTPMSDAQVLVKHHQVDAQEFGRLFMPRLFFFGSYLKIRTAQKKKGHQL